MGQKEILQAVIGQNMFKTELSASMRTRRNLKLRPHSTTETNSGSNQDTAFEMRGKDSESGRSTLPASLWPGQSGTQTQRAPKSESRLQLSSPSQIPPTCLGKAWKRCGQRSTGNSVLVGGQLQSTHAPWHTGGQGNPPPPLA